jgi:Spy/CpxP family protein refolding chaperone
MKRLVLAMLAAAAVGGAAAGPLQAQHPGATRGGGAEVARPQEPGIGFLLKHRADLELADQQITRLEQITERLKAENEPLQQRLREAGIPVGRDRHAAIQAMTPEQRRVLRERLGVERPTLLEMRRNADRAMRQARGVLTPAQRERLRELSREHAEEIRGRHGRGGGGPTGARPAPRSPRN